LAVRRRDAAPEGLLHAATLARLLVVAVPAQAAGQVDGVLLRPRVPGPGTDLEAHGRQPLLRDVELDGAERQTLAIPDSHDPDFPPRVGAKRTELRHPGKTYVRPSEPAVVARDPDGLGAGARARL